MNIDDIRCVFEAIILPVLSWLGSIFARKKQAATESMQRDGGQAGAAEGHPPEHALKEPAPSPVVAEGDPQIEHAAPGSPGITTGSMAGSSAWDAYLEKQAALQGAAAGIAAQSALAARPGMPRWLRDFGPGALGALIVTIGFAAVLLLSGPTATAEEKDNMQALAFVELLCIPIALVAGALIGVLASLLARAITKAVHLGERAQMVAATIVGAISGAVTGLLWDLFVVIGSAF